MAVNKWELFEQSGIVLAFSIGDMMSRIGGQLYNNQNHSEQNWARQMMSDTSTSDQLLAKSFLGLQPDASTFRNLNREKIQNLWAHIHNSLSTKNPRCVKCCGSGGRTEIKAPGSQ